METKKIIIEEKDGQRMTSVERDQMLVRQVEKVMNTGPIIGEAKEIIEALSRNLVVRDLMLDLMGVDVNAREKAFVLVTGAMEKRDAEILKEREEKK